MADPAPKSPAKKKAKSAAADAARARAASESRPGGDALTAWRTWALAGVVLIGGIVAWKLLGSTYRSDVDTICNAEKGSGFTMQKDMSKVTAYIRSHLATPEGNELYSTMGDAKLLDRAKKIQAEADAQHVGACPIVASYEQLAAEGDYRSDLQRICSGTTFPKLGELDDDARLAKLEDWIDHQAKSPRTKELSDPLRQGTPADRAKLLRETAAKMDVFTCDVGKTLEGPVLPSKGKGPPQVRPYSEPQINGVLAPADLAKGLVEVTPAMNDCYKKGLEVKPDLGGKMAIKLKVDPSGKVTSARPADMPSIDAVTVRCVLGVLEGMKLPSNPGPLVTVLLPLELTTEGVAPPPGAPGASGAPPAAPASGAPPAPTPSAKPSASAPTR